MTKFNSVIYEVKNCIEDSTLMLSWCRRELHSLRKISICFWEVRIEFTWDIASTAYFNVGI